MTTDPLSRVASDAEGEGTASPSAPTNVVEVPCPCPGRPHPVDRVTLHEHVTLPMGVAASRALLWCAQSGGTPADQMAALAVVYLHHGIADWTFDEPDPDPKAERGSRVPVPVTPANADRLLGYVGGMLVATRADQLLSDELIRPLGAPTSNSSPAGQTESTSAPPEKAADSSSRESSAGPTPSSPSARSSRRSSAAGTASEAPAP